MLLVNPKYTYICKKIIFNLPHTCMHSYKTVIKSFQTLHFITLYREFITNITDIDWTFTKSRNSVLIPKILSLVSARISVKC